MATCNLPIRDQTPVDAIGCALAPVKRAFEGIGSATIGQWWDALSWIVLLFVGAFAIGMVIAFVGSLSAKIEGRRTGGPSAPQQPVAVASAPQPPNIGGWIVMVMISGLASVALFIAAVTNLSLVPALFLPFPLIVLVSFGRLLWEQAKRTP